MVIARELGDDCPEYGTPDFKPWYLERCVVEKLVGLKPKAEPALPTKTWAEMTPKERQDAAARLSDEQKAEISNRLVAEFLARLKAAEDKRQRGERPLSPPDAGERTYRSAARGLQRGRSAG